MTISWLERSSKTQIIPVKPLIFSSQGSSTMFLLACHVFFSEYGHLRQPERFKSYSSISLLAVKKFLAHPSRRSFYSICRAVVNLGCFALSLKFNSCFHGKFSVMELKKIVMKLWDLGSETQVFHRSLLINFNLIKSKNGIFHNFQNLCWHNYPKLWISMK